VNGLCEPAGVILAWCVGSWFTWEPRVEGILAGVAGIMIGISTMELLPYSVEHTGSRRELVQWTGVGFAGAAFVLFLSDVIQTHFL
jgi:zinc transporter ZupT